MDNTSNSNIKCSVESCAYHNCDDYCSLKEITVGCNCSSDDVCQKGETECLSFEAGSNDK